MKTVMQTITTTNSDRPGNCVAAAVASWLGKDLDEVPHFLELGMQFGDESDPAKPSETNYWWVLLIGYMAGHGYWPVVLDSLDDAWTDEAVFVTGMASRGLCHEVLYRNGELLHDPHPSREGVIDVRRVTAWRPVRHDHNPTHEAGGDRA